MEALFAVVALILGAYSVILVILRSKATAAFKNDEDFFRSIREYERAASKFHRE